MKLNLLVKLQEQEPFELTLPDGRELILKKPTKPMTELMQTIQLQSQQGFTAELLSSMYVFIHRIVNRNTTGEEIELSYVESEISPDLVIMILKEYATWSFNSTKDPN